MSCEAERESTFQEPAEQTRRVTQGSPPLPDQADAPQPQRRSLPPILPESTLRLQVPQQQEAAGESPTTTALQEQHHRPQQLDERAVFVIPNCPPTCAPDNPGSCPQVLVLPFLPTASTRNNQGMADEGINSASKNNNSSALILHAVIHPSFYEPPPEYNSWNLNTCNCNQQQESNFSTIRNCSYSAAPIGRNHRIVSNTVLGSMNIKSTVYFGTNGRRAN